MYAILTKLILFCHVYTAQELSPVVILRYIPLLCSDHHTTTLFASTVIYLEVADCVLFWQGVEVCKLKVMSGS